MKSRTTYFVICLLAVLVLTGALFAGRGYWQVYGVGGWRDQLYASEGAVASKRALDDFRAGHLRLYTLGGESEQGKYTGTNYGSFEIWIPRYYPSLGRAERFRAEQFVEFYNRKMRYMHEHPEDFVPQKKDVQQDAAVNQSQPVHAVPVSTPLAAGSGH